MMKALNVIVATSALAIVALAAAQGPGQGQGRPPMGGGGPRGMMGRRFDPKQMADRETQRLAQGVGLTPAQQAKVKAIYLKAAMDMKRIRDTQEAAIKKVLTADQLKKIASMRGPGGMGGPGGMRRGQ